MKHKEMLTEAKRLFAEARELLANDPDPDALARAETLIAEAQDMKARASELVDLDAAIEDLRRNDEQVVRTNASEFKDWRQFLSAVGMTAMGQRPDARLRFFKDRDEEGMERKDLAEGVGATGGFLVPTEFQAQLQAVLGEGGIVRQRATPIRMSRRQIQVPVLDQTDTTAGLPAWYGGMQAYWAEEAAEKTETDPNFRQATLTAWKLIMYTRASDELLDDSAISLTDFLTGPMGFAGAIGWYEDYAFLRGTGAGQPLGVVNAAATVTVPRAGAGAVAYSDLTDMMENFLPNGNGVWVISQTVMSELLQLSGPAGNPSYIWGSAVAGAPNTLLGLPVIWTEKLPALGTAGDVMLADFRYYLIGDRMATTIESTKYDRWRYDQTSWRAVHRVDGQPWLSAPITLQDGTATVSPFVILGDAA